MRGLQRPSHRRRRGCPKPISEIRDSRVRTSGAQVSACGWWPSHCPCSLSK